MRDLPIGVVLLQAENISRERVLDASLVFEARTIGAFAFCESDSVVVIGSYKFGRTVLQVCALERVGCQ